MKEHKNKPSRKKIIDNVRLRHYIILSALTYIVFLFPKLFGAKFFTAVDMFIFIFKTGNNMLIPLSLLIFFCVILMLDTIALIAILKSKSYLKKDTSWPHLVFVVNIVLIILFGLFIGLYFDRVEGGHPNNLVSELMGYSFWAYQILGYGIALSFVIVEVWSWIFMGKEEFRKKTEREGLSENVPQEFKSNTTDYIVYLAVFLLAIVIPLPKGESVIQGAISGALRVIMALFVAYLVTWILKRKRAGKKNKAKRS